MSRVANVKHRVVPAAKNDDTSSSHYRFFLFDCETTGLSAATNRIVEVAIQEYIPNQHASSMRPHTVLINPDTSMPAAALAIHGISDDMLADAPTFADAWSTVENYVKSRCYSDECPVLVAHNAFFDTSFIREELNRASLPVPNWLAACTLVLARAQWPGKSNRLEAIASRIGVKHDAHRAGGDIIALSSVLDAMDKNQRKLGTTVQAALVRNTKPLMKFSSSPARAGGWKKSVLDNLERNTANSRRATETAPVDSPVQASTPARSPSPEARVPVHAAAALNDEIIYTGSSGDDDSGEAPYYRTPTGTKYHVRSDCYGMTKARKKIPCETKPFDLDPCKVCVLKIEYQNYTSVQHVPATSHSSRSYSPRSIKGSSGNDDSGDAPYYRTPTGTKYHVRSDCYGMTKARKKIPCETKPFDLDPCKVCVLKVAYQNY